MQRKHLGKKAIRTFICLIFAAALLFPANVPLYMSYAESPSFIIDYESRVADPDTSSPSNMGFLNIPRLHDGRVWTDKSVQVNPDPGADDFIVTLSALSQSFSLSENYVVPTDTVFIIDVSGSMYMESIGGRPRIAVLVDALNEAVQILLDANPQNRIAVVAYGGRSGGFSRAENVISLGRPELMPGSTAFFAYRQVGTLHYLDVNTTNKAASSVLVQGSTPTQRGILIGSRILEAADSLTIPALDPLGNPVTDGSGNPEFVTRKPNFILMTDGEPTMAWSDYLFITEPNDTNQTHGDGSNGETGVSLLTILTAAHRKRLVHEHYYEYNPAHDSDVLNYSSSGNEPVGFYTISLNNVPPPLLISATMYPFIPGSTGEPGNADNATPSLNINTLAGAYPSGPPTFAPMDSIGTLLRSFISPASITFYIQLRLVYPNYIWQPLTIDNPQNLTLEELVYADRFFAADDLDTLRDAFLQVATEIQRQSYSAVTDLEPGQEEFDGYLVFSDALGEYMEFRGIFNFEFNNVSFSRAGFGEIIINNTGGERTAYEDILYHHMNYGNMPGNPGYNPLRYVTKTQVVELIQSNITAGYLASNNSLKYYAYGNRDFAGSVFNPDGTEAAIPADAVAVVDVFPMWGTLGSPVLDGGTTNLMYITFHVVTALDNNIVFEEVFSTDSAGNPLNRLLNKGNQLIRWYIPAGLIPQRKVNHSDGSQTGNLLPVRVHYKVGLNKQLVEAGVSEEYRALHSINEDVYFYTNHHPRNVTLAFYQPNEFNPYYQPGRPGYNERGIAKAANPTESASHVIQYRHTYASGAGRTDIQWLGNNGRMTVDLPELPLTDGIEKSPQTGTYHRFSPYVILLISGLVLTCTGLFFICKKDSPFKAKIHEKGGFR